MKIANVIVDIPAMQTDKYFDYRIPEKWETAIQPGMRVIVPFGPRTIQGFVAGIKDRSEVKNLREIIAPQDLAPVLNAELLALGDWLAKETLCLKISAYQAMLPAAMKAKYEKRIKRQDGGANPFLDEVFKGHDEISWKEAQQKGFLPFLQKEAKNGSVEVVYEVKSKANKKTVRLIFCPLSKDELEKRMEEVPKNAPKQKQVLQFFLENPDAKMPSPELAETAGVSRAVIKTLLEKGWLEEKQEESYRDPYADRQFQKSVPHALTAEQKQAIGPVLSAVRENRNETFLLFGVTGSGKTEIYLQSIQEVLNQGKEAIVLVPEISLTPQMVNRFKSRFGKDVAVLHSGLSVGEKYDEWRKITRKEAKVVVGARSAIFAPLENLGIIIIDEEHENSYKQEDNPRYHARDVALFRSKNHHCPVILGSATPSLESFARAQKGVYTLLKMGKRMNNHPLPEVSIVDMREELRAGNRSMFSRELFEKLKDRLEKKQQTVLLLNKRGYSSFVMCRDCGYVQQCPNCDISLTYHRSTNEMKCHYCGYETFVPATCPECGSSHIRYFGTGTQKVEEELGRLLPEARVIRMDVDTTGRKGAHERMLQSFANGEADILLGTQMIAKGLDFPNITLVGVLNADTILHLPDFRASEKTFQLLTQVSGRAGRHQLEGEVVVQTYTPEHYSIQFAGEQDYERFYRQEMRMRKVGAYPPFYYLTLITVSHENVMKAMSAAEKIAGFMRNRVSGGSVILGPSACPVPRVKNRYRYQCLIKYKREPRLNETLSVLLEHFQHQIASEGLSIAVDVNPNMMM